MSILTLLVNAGFATNAVERSPLPSPQAVAQAAVDRVAPWRIAVQAVQIAPPEVGYPLIRISVNGQLYGDAGAIVDDSAYIPVQVIDRLGIDIPRPTLIRLTNTGETTYVQAIDLRQAGVSVGWNPVARTVLVRTLEPFDLSQVNQIMGAGYVSESDLTRFLRSENPDALEEFAEIARLYAEEAAIEGVKPELAFAQALLETNFLRFDRRNPSHNNFGGLQGIGGGSAVFPSARLGVRAHIQHLKAYASAEPLVQVTVDPRFRFVDRSSAPRVELLGTRWSADPLYGGKLLAILRQLYQSAGLI